MTAKVLITGGSRGIGKAIAQTLAADYSVLAPGSKDLDVTNQASIEKFFQVHFNSDTKLHALVCNAGIFHSQSFENYDISDWLRIFDVNLHGAFRATKQALPYLQNAGLAHVIMISSISMNGEAHACAYSASKAGLIGLAKTLAQELAKYNINVNAIAPGWVRTDMALDILDTENKVKDNLGATLQNRWIEPEEIASLVQYLISPVARAITGQVINISAGL